ncbi:MAG: glycoside hydrolase family 3 C-terminal domain-containing protein [Paludibacter sp.]|nr:glycoside hydrolase family 3 C-terminal domain-containing protein [Paludibacter sp.]
MNKITTMLVCSILTLGLLSAQNKNTKKPAFESDITGSKQKLENLNDFLPLSSSPNAIKNAIYADVTKPAAERAQDLIRRLTFEEKLSMTGGYNRFQVAPVPRLGIRPVFMADASQGVRMQTLTIKGKSTSFPGMLPLASTWNGDLAKAFGTAMGEECKALGVDILLGPGMNMQRLSVGGRNFEYMGEDPLLTSVIASNYVSGMESTGVVSCPKHFVANDQEFCRHIANSVVSERALREIYLPAWKAVIQKGKASSIMTGNNLVNGTPAPINKELNADILRKEYGFQGIAMTDWQNTNYFPSFQHLVLPSGETLLMPDNEKFAAWVNKEIEKSPTRKAEIEILLEKMIYPTLYTLFNKGVYDRAPQDESYMNTLPVHKQLAHQCAEESIVLLKNEKNILPVASGKNIVMVGKPEIHSGEGSGFVQGYDHVTFEHGLKAVYGDKFTYLKELDAAVVKKADVVIFNFNKRSGEGRDVPFEAGSEEIAILKKITSINKNVIVLMNSCNTMPFEWTKEVKGLLWCYFLGQERGNALADIISGKVSPSGKLPFTIEKNFKDGPDPDFNYLGNKPFWMGNNQYKKYWLGETSEFDTAFTNYVKPFTPIPVPYKEETLIGYRWYDYHKIPVHFPFGYGLSYSQFRLNKMTVENNISKDGTIAVEVELQNTGKIAAKEVVQIYVSDKQSSVVRAPKELKAFQKIALQAGEKTTLRFVLDKSALSFWDESTHDWKLEPGEFVISAGNSSADLKWQESLVVN